MARPRKTGLDYFPFDVDFFEDDKLSAISVQYGIKGEIAAVKLLCAIYRDGYFIEWKESVCIKLLRELPGISESLMEQIVRGLVKWGFFDKALFDTAHILTSRGIQRRYFSISRRNRRSGQGGELPYLLVDDGTSETDMEKKDIPKEGILEFSATETVLSQRKTGFSATKTPQIKEIKDKYSTANRTCEDMLDAEIEQLKISSVWLEHIRMRHKVSLEEVNGLFEEFAADCRCNGMTQHENLTDVQRHFNNWLRIRKEHEQQGREDRGRDGAGALRKQAYGIIARMQAEDDAAAKEVR